MTIVESCTATFGLKSNIFWTLYSVFVQNLATMSIVPNISGLIPMTDAEEMVPKIVPVSGTIFSSFCHRNYASCVFNCSVTLNLVQVCTCQCKTFRPIIFVGHSVEIYRHTDFISWIDHMAQSATCSLYNGVVSCAIKWNKSSNKMVDKCVLFYCNIYFILLHIKPHLNSWWD